MTGYGQAQRARGEVSVEAELRSVNSRHLSLKFRLPGDLVRLEPAIDTIMRKHLARGAVDVFVRVNVGKRKLQPSIDQGVLKVYRRALHDLGGHDTAALLSLPGVVTLAEQGPSSTVVDRLALGAVKDATAQLVEARADEGARLQTAMQRELETLGRHRDAVARRVPDLVAIHQRQLSERLAALLSGERLDADDPVLKREVALLADRGDVTEELDRLASHLVACRKAMEARRKGTVGRRLDFLLQEIGREVNTIGGKTNDLKVTGHVIEMKSAVEKLREQAANIE